MFKRLMGVGLAFGMAATAPLTAHAAACAPRDVIAERLASRYSEKLTLGGLQATANEQAVLEVWTSPETGTFTILRTDVHGVSCVVAAGTDVFTLPVATSKDDIAG